MGLREDELTTVGETIHLINFLKHGNHLGTFTANHFYVVRTRNKSACIVLSNLHGGNRVQYRKLPPKIFLEILIKKPV